MFFSWPLVFLQPANKLNVRPGELPDYERTLAVKKEKVKLAHEIAAAGGHNVLTLYTV